ncbi:MAG: metallophosphoesterase [Bacteroidota bacterium]
MTLRPSDSRAIAHLSDVHFGKIAHPGIVDAIVADVNEMLVDVVVVSGDLTQRARTAQFEAARAMLDAFWAPVIVVPGNHDVRAWWHHPVDRLWRPTLRFRQHITDDLTPTYEDDEELAVFGLNSAHGWTIKGGRIRPEDLRAMEAFFAQQPASALRVLTLHHHLTRLDALGPHDVSRGARAALDAARRARVDLVLCGHLHRSHVALAEGGEGRRLVIASAGTATSSRGRAENRNVNFYNLIDVRPEALTVEERRFDPEAVRFETARETTFGRLGGA